MENSMEHTRTVKIRKACTVYHRILSVTYSNKHVLNCHDPGAGTLIKLIPNGDRSPKQIKSHKKFLTCLHNTMKSIHNFIA